MGFFRKVEDEIKDVGRKIDDEIIQPVKNTVETIIEDPKKLAAVAIAVAFPGAGAALGASLGLTGTAATVVGQTLLNTALNGGDVKSAIVSAAIPVVGKEVAGTLGTTLAKSGIEGTVNQVITRAATQGVTAAVLGKDPLAAALLGGTTAAVNAIVPDIPGYKDLPPSAKNAVNSAITAKLTGKNAGDAVSQSLVNDTISWAKSEVGKLKNSTMIKQLSDSGMQGGDLNPQQVAQIRADLGLPPEEGGTYTGVDVAGPGDGTASIFVPSWMSLRADERVIGTRTTEEGTNQYIVQRMNPNNPEQFIEYSVDRDPVTGKTWYQQLGSSKPGEDVLVSASQKKPTVDWDAEEGPGSVAPEQPPEDEFASTDPLEGFPMDLLSKPSDTSTQPPTSTANVTPAQVEKIVNDAIKANPNLTKEDVQKIVSDAVATVPNLTADQVKNIVGAEVSKLPVGASPSDVQKTVDAAKKELTEAVEKVAAGAATGDADLKKAIEALKASGLTPADVQKVVDASAANQNAATKQAITDATKNLATTDALETARNDLAREIQAARDIGLKGDAALQAGLGSLAAKMGVNQAEVLKQLGTSTDALRKEFGTGLADVTAAQKAQYDALTAAQKAEADARIAQGKTMQEAISAAQQTTTGQIAGLEAKTTEQYNALTAAQKAEADARIAQGQTLQEAIAAAQKATTGQIAGLEAKTTQQYNALTAAQKAEADARVAQGQSLQDAITGVSGQVAGIGTQLTQQGKDFAAQLMQQGMDYKTAMQTAIDAQSALFGTQIGGVQSQLAAAEAARQADVAAQIQREQAAAAKAAEAAKQANIQNLRTQGQQGVRSVMEQLQDVQKAGMAPQPVQVVEAGPGFDISDALNTGFFSSFQAKKAQQNQPQTTKIAAGGYIDDLLAEDMSVDDLMNLLR